MGHMDGRATVCMGDSERPFAVGMEVEVHLLRQQPELNGSVGKVIGYVREGTRVAVQFDWGKKGFKKENLRPTGTQKLDSEIVRKAEEDRKRQEEEAAAEVRRQKQEVAEREMEKLRLARERLQCAKLAERGVEPAVSKVPEEAQGGTVNRWYSKFDSIAEDEDIEQQERRAELRRVFQANVQELSESEAAGRDGVSAELEAAVGSLRSSFKESAVEAIERQRVRMVREGKAAAISRALGGCRTVPPPPSGWTGRGGPQHTCRPPDTATVLAGVTHVPGRLLAGDSRGAGEPSLPLGPVLEQLLVNWVRTEECTGVSTLLRAAEGKPPQPLLPPQIPRMPEQLPHPDAAGAKHTVYEVSRVPRLFDKESFVQAAQVDAATAEDAFYRIGYRFSSKSVCICLLHTLSELRRHGWKRVQCDGGDIDIDDFRIRIADFVPTSLHTLVVHYESGHRTVELLEDSQGDLFTHFVLVNRGWICDPTGASRGWAGHRQPLQQWLDYQRLTDASRFKVREVPERTEDTDAHYRKFEKRIDAVVAGTMRDLLPYTHKAPAPRY
eukprot:TRINITY_DN47903_c0_g1_i1.p1 TRINITY_DN47903_c0_g1~~TRINITY_DN47903_c0_g1_i1.p1  ORF type:complete len:554 (+),score=103.14 TRINITY_DN47903_c0_g1_i1:64-1725(+)